MRTLSWRNAEANIFPEEGTYSNLDLCDDVTQGGLRNGAVTHIILSLTDLKEIILATAQVLLNFKHTDLYQCDIRLHYRDGMFKLRRSPGIDSASQCSLAGLCDYPILLGSYPP